MSKKLLKRLGLVAVLVGIISILIPSMVFAAPSCWTALPYKLGTTIYVNGYTSSLTYYQNLYCQTQLWYYDGSWHWLDTQSVSGSGLSVVAQAYHSDVASTYQGASNHTWWNPGGDYGSCSTYGPIANGL